MDLKDFFPSIKTPRVRELFNRVGYSKEVAFYLSRLCCLNDSIPQGAASSPIISNIILKTLDNRLSKLSFQSNLTYSRYADDMVFSGKHIPIGLEEIVNNKIETLGFDINKSKTKRYNKKCRKMVTGIVVGETEIRLPKYKRREIRQEVYFMKKFQISDQVKMHNDLFYVDRVLGRLSYWKQIEPENIFVRNSIKEIKEMYSKFIEGKTE
jgi:retron-type reverse transcriptase